MFSILVQTLKPQSAVRCLHYLTTLNKAKHGPKAKLTTNEFKGPEWLVYERIIVRHNALKGKCILLAKLEKQIKGNKVNSPKNAMECGYWASPHQA